MFEGRLALNPGLNLTRVSFSFVQKNFSVNFLCYFEKHSIINLLTKRIEVNLLFKLSYLNSNFALTLGYLNPALNDPAQSLNCHSDFDLLEVKVYKLIKKKSYSTANLESKFRNCNLLTKGNKTKQV